MHQNDLSQFEQHRRYPQATSIPVYNGVCNGGRGKSNDRDGRSYSKESDRIRNQINSRKFDE